MKTYEITFITREEPKDSAVKKEIENAGGKILNISSMGQKTFVYPIEKEKSGFYTTYLFEMEPEKLQDFNHKLAMEDEIVRHLIIGMKPSDIIAKENASKSLDEKTTVLEKKPETKLMVEPEMALEIEPEKAVVEETAPTETIVREKTEVKEEKPAKKTVKKAVKAEPKEETKIPAEKTEVKEEKPKKPAKKVEEKAIDDEEERLEALDKKLEELLKE